MANKLLPADIFVVYKRQMLHDNDRNILTLLYQPIIGAEALSLYLIFWSLLDGVVVSKEKTHHYLMATTHWSTDKIIAAREKLEAVGLLKTYFKQTSTNNYLYELYAPLLPNDFFQNPILSAGLQDSLGAEEYQRLSQMFICEQIDLTDFQDISKNFQDVFQMVNYQVDDNDYMKRETINLQVKNAALIEQVLARISDEIINHKLIGDNEKNYLQQLVYAYDLNEATLKEFIISSVNQYKKIDLLKLRKKAEKNFQYDNEGKLPKIALQSQPEKLRKKGGQLNKRNQMIHIFETTPPRDFLLSKNGGSTITPAEQNILAYLLLDLKLNPGVVNVLLDYVLRINDNKLTKNFVITIASQWKKAQVETVQQAMEIAEREFKRRKSYQKKQSYQTKTEQTPDWFDQKLEGEKPSQEEQAEIEKMLENYR